MISMTLKQQLVQTINAHVNAHFIILFGSGATGNMTEDSDLDIAYLSDRILSSYDRFLLAGQLARIAGREVDLVDIKQIDTIFTMQIFTEGQVIDCQNQNELTRQQIRAYSMYAAFAEERAPIVQAIKDQGSVF